MNMEDMVRLVKVQRDATLKASGQLTLGELIRKVEYAIGGKDPASKDVFYEFGGMIPDGIASYYDELALATIHMSS